MKKLMTILLCLTMCFALPLVAEAEGFTDVAGDHWAYNAIQYFYNAGVIEGMGDNTFSPDSYVTREQLAKLISIIYSKTYQETGSQTFSDVTPDMWSYKYIESVKEYLTGYYPADGKAFFNPTGFAAREDIAYALVKISGLYSEETSDTTLLDGYKDSADISPSLKEYVASAVNCGLMQGYDGYLRPQDGITRAETVTLLFRAIKKPVSQEEKNDEKPDEETGENQDENKPEQEETDKKTLTLKEGKIYKISTDKILQISGYRENEIIGEIYFEYSSEDAIFTADMNCKDKNSISNYMSCKIEMTEFTSIDGNKIKGEFDVYIGGALKTGSGKGAITLDNRVLSLEIEDTTYNLKAEYSSVIESTKAYSEKVKNEMNESKNEKTGETATKPKNFVPFSIESKKILQFKDYTQREIKGFADITVSPEFAIFETDFKCTYKATPDETLEVKIELVEMISSSSKEVQGYFDVYMNGELKNDNAKGTITFTEPTYELTIENTDYSLKVQYDPTIVDNPAYYTENEILMGGSTRTLELRIPGREKITYYSENSKSPLNGILRIQFFDTFDETKLLSHILVENKQYYMFSKSFITDECSFNSEIIKLAFYCDIYCETELVLKNTKVTCNVNRIKDKAIFENKYFTMVFQTSLHWPVKTPEITPQAPEKPTEEGTTYISALTPFEDVQKTWGYAEIAYNREAYTASATIWTYYSLWTYKYELTEITEMNDNEIIGVFQVKSSDGQISHITNGKISNYTASDGEIITVKTDMNYDNWNGELTVVHKD